MSRLTCGTRTRSNSFSPSPSRSPSLSSYLSASPRSGPSPTNHPSSCKFIKPNKEQSPKKKNRKLVRSLTMPSAENSLLPVKVLFPSSNEFEDGYPSTKGPNFSAKFKNQVLAEFQSKLSSNNGDPRRTKSYPPSAIHGRFVPTVYRPDSLRTHSKKSFDALCKGAKPKSITSLVQPSRDNSIIGNKTLEILSDTNNGTTNKPKKSSNAVSQTVISVLPKKKSKKKHNGKSMGKSDDLLLKVGTFSRVLNAMKK